MNKLLTVLTGVGQPLRPEDWEFIQNANLEVIKSIMLGLGAQKCILLGLEIVVNGADLIVSDGYIFDGDEISYVPGATFTYHGDAIVKVLDGSGQWHLYLTQAITEGENRTFKDASTHDVWQYRRYALGYAEQVPEGSTALSSIKLILDLISDYVISVLPSPSLGVDIKERKVTFYPDELDQYMLLIPAPGAGKVIQVIACCAKIAVSTKLEVGTQKLYVTYGTDITTPGIGEFSNAFLENPITTIDQMTPSLDYMYENQAVNVGFSGETRPSAGSASIVINVIYKIIEF